MAVGPLTFGAPHAPGRPTVAQHGAIDNEGGDQPVSVFPTGHAVTLTGLADGNAQGYDVLRQALAEFSARHQASPGRGAHRPVAEIAEELLRQVQSQQPHHRWEPRGRGFLLGHIDGRAARWTPTDDAAAGLATVLRIVGPPRSGKTTLAAGLAAQADHAWLVGDDHASYLAVGSSLRCLTAEQLLAAPPRDCALLIVDSSRPAIQRWGSRMAAEARTTGTAVILVDIPRDTHGVSAQGVCVSLVVPGLGTVEVPHAPAVGLKPVCP